MKYEDVWHSMSNDFWNYQQNGNDSSQKNTSLRTGSLLRDYRQQQQQQNPQQHSPTLMPQTPTPPPYSPMPPAPRQEQAPQQPGWPSPQSWPSSTNKKEQGHGWLSNTVDMVRRWSAGRIAAAPPVDQNPLVLYRPSSPPPPVKSKPWKRSRAIRIAIQMRHRRERWKQSRPKVMAIVSGILIALLLLLVTAASSATGYAYQYYQSQLPRLQGLANQQIEQTTRIYDRNGYLLYEAYNQQQGGGRRTAVSYKYLPQVLQNAQIAAEDPTFWTNIGVDPQAILRAGGQYVQAGSVVSGASTMTQQLIKNMTNDTAETLNRKISEAALAIGLTQQYPKWKIMEMYFNVSPYGAENLGVEAAVEDYFHLSAQCDKNFNCTPGVYYLNCDSSHIQQCDPAHCDTSKYCDPLLGLARAALLAGMPQDPPTYDPTFGYVDQSTGQKYYLERQQYVFSQMLKLGMQVDGLGTITQDMVDKAEALTTKMKFPPYNHAYYHGCQQFVQWVIMQLEEQLGEQTFLTGGFNVRTTIDYRLEAYVEMAVHRHLQEPDVQLFPSYRVATLSSPDYNVYDAAAVVMNAKTGEILAMDGSADYNSSNPEINGNFNAALAPRQPGSSFKPIVYATAFQQGWYPGIVLTDQKTYFPNGGGPIAQDNYVPADYGGNNFYHNAAFPIRTSLADSYNVPAVKAFKYAGIENVVNTARRFGITAIDDDLAAYNANNHTHVALEQHFGPSMALGTAEVPLIQMVGAYQVFADQGTRVPPQGVLDIWDNYGHLLYHYDPSHPQGIQVISPQIAFLMTSVLSDEYARASEFWPDHDLSFWNGNTPDAAYPDVAAKTGTTDDFRDNWTIGYTSDVVVGVWAGNADNSPFGQQVVGITGAAPIWHSVMEHINNICNSSEDQLPCSPVNYGFQPQTFTPPPGVIKSCVSTANGLMGGGNCDWMLNSDVPQQSGFTNTSNKPTPTPTP